MMENNKEDIISSEEKSLSDDSNSKKNKKDKNTKHVFDYSKFSSSVIKIHVSLVFLVYSLVFSHNQTLKNKNLKDEEISENDYYLGLVYIITLIISLIIGVNAFFTLSSDYEGTRSEDIFEKNFMRLRKIEIVTTAILSYVFWYSLLSLMNEGVYASFYIYTMSCSLYHFMEYMFVCNYHFKKLSFDSFLLNQSKEFVCAILFSFAEYHIEFYFFPSFKNNFFFSIFGFFLMMIGQYCRIAALFTAKSNFTHLVALRKKETHKLVKSGIYRFLRHPSYFGFFWWAIGAQILCMNPISLVGYYFVLCEFFRSRIEAEEYYLVRFFEREYEDYMKETGIKIPFYQDLLKSKTD